MSPGRTRIPLLGRVRGRLVVLLPLLLGAALLTPAPAGAAPTAASPAPAAADGLGLRGDYYRMSSATALDFASYTGTRIDNSLHVDDLLPTLRTYAGTTDNVAVRWTGRLEVPADGAYTFYIKGDNGFRMSLDGTSVINHWTTDWDVQTTSEAITLTAGLHDLVVDYNQGNGGAYLHTEWSGPGFARRPLPDSALHLPAGFAPADAKATVGRTGRTATVELPSALASVPADAAAHLAVVSGGTLWHPTVAKDPKNPAALVVTAGKDDTPVSLNADVRVSYDGKGGITTAQGGLGPFSVVAQNDSTWYFATPWAKDVSADNALPEYPRPQLTRKNWQNLNGTWQFQATAQDAALPTGKLTGKILVPYPMESGLSGVARHHDWSLYQRTFTVPHGWKVGSGNRLRLNFGAVDHETWIYVNGKQVAHHVGGYEEFSADITDALSRRGQQTLLVKVKDTTDDKYAVGKQSAAPSGIWYTPTSGIWQTVWMEPVPEAAVDSLVLTPDLKDDSLSVTVRPTATTPGTAKVTATAYAGKRPVGSVTGRVGTALRVPVKKPHLWSPDDPYLYDLKVTVDGGRSGKDRVASYFGMRSIEVAPVGGVNKILLNGRPTFVMSTLDQGFWPDGLYTAPTDEALKSDLVEHKKLGFNAVRKHIKVEPARWYYWADRLGLMVWQDMPSRMTAAAGTPETQTWIDQAHEIVDQHLSTPSIVMWTIMNEGWGEWSKSATGELADAVKKQDPSRLVDAHSGVNCCASKGDSGRGDVIDWHDYHGPANPAPDAARAAVDGEHGGYSYVVPGHILGTAGGQDYGDAATSTEELTKAYVENTRKLIQRASCGLSGSVYTQITDVEGELNGLLTYDRKVVKVLPGPVRDINRQVIAAGAASGGTDVPPGTPGLSGVSWWPLHQQSGTVADDVAGGHDGTLKGGATWTAGPHGGAVQLDGSTGYVDAGAPVLDTEKGDYSVAAWVRLDDKGHFSTAVSLDGDRNSVFYLQYAQADKRFAFSFAGSRALANTIGEPQTGKWYHLVGSYSHRDGTLRVYVDGTEAGSTRACNAEVPAGNLVIGRGKYNGAPVDHWAGALADVHAYDRALSAAEVASLAAREPTAPTGR
ncbi:LamG-like jellyroll fold domain-containing protein [Streptomyces galbus]|uniref:Glycoside hydrolase family 2 n=1 Tax=Streptomyces galbus TaxID=33898 RepID=A0A4U5W6C6_STRGB|nr:LamG-like jellyroll fold domain-containing protein [Streptomyces galbus]TKS97066.1 glycoside hydrolase family 2 [Streptomyces galbus]